MSIVHAMSNIIRFVYFCAIILCLMSLAVLLVFVRDGIPQPELTIHFLDIGQGDAIFIETPEHTQILVDAGAGRQVMEELSDIMPWWDRSIDYLVITHPDLDHYGGFAHVVRSFKVGEVLWNGTEDDAAYFQDLLHEVERRGIMMRILAAGDVFHWSSGVTFRILWPEPGYTAEKNARSLVALLSYRDQDILLTGDLPQAEELRMLAAYPQLTAEILKVGHHGSASSSGPLFLQQLDPEQCIISAGKDNRYGHPAPAVIERLRAVNCEVRTTLEQGRISYASDGYSIYSAVESFRLWKTLKYAILGVF